jgi:acyl dehydratase
VSYKWTERYDTDALKLANAYKSGLNLQKMHRGLAEHIHGNPYTGVSSIKGDNAGESLCVGLPDRPPSWPVRDETCWDTYGVIDDSQHPVRYFEDYVPGLTVDCGTFTISEAEIIAFAKQYDPQPFHVDPAAAAAGPVGGLIASGWQTVSLTMRLLVEHFISGETGLGAAGVEDIRWPRPVRPGDTLHVRATVTDARRSRSKPDRGIIQSMTEVTNQDGETVMTMKATNFFLTRDPEH